MGPSRAADAPETVSGFDAVIHLAGESIFGRWTAGKKSKIRDSRVVGTFNLSSALAQAEEKPRVFVCGSAIGYYGNRGDEIVARGKRSGRGVSRRGLPGLGRSDHAGRAGRHSHSTYQDWGRAQSQGRRARSHAAAVQDGTGRSNRQRSAMDELDRCPRHGRRDPSHFEERSDPGTGEHGRA